MLSKTKIRVWLDVGCSAVRIGVVEEKDDAPAQFLVLERESFEPQARLLDNPAVVARALSRLRERVEVEHQLVFSSAYVGLRGDFVYSMVKNDSVQGGRQGVKHKDVQHFLQKIRSQTEDLLQLEVLGLAIRGESGWQTVQLDERESSYVQVQLWWLEWRARAEGKQLLREVLKLGDVDGVDGYYAHAPMVAQSALPDNLHNANLVLIIDLGASGSDQMLVKRGAVVFSSSLTTGGVALSHALAHRLKVSYLEAEAGKCAGAWREELEALYAEQIFQPLKSALLQARGKLALDRVILTGGGASALAVQVAERVFACGAQQAKVDEHWQSKVPAEWWQHAPREDYLPLLGLYGWWYKRAREYEPAPNEGLMQTLKNWFKKISD